MPCPGLPGPGTAELLATKVLSQLGPCRLSSTTTILFAGSAWSGRIRPPPPPPQRQAPSVQRPPPPPPPPPPWPSFDPAPGRRDLSHHYTRRPPEGRSMHSPLLSSASSPVHRPRLDPGTASGQKKVVPRGTGSSIHETPVGGRGHWSLQRARVSSLDARPPPASASSPALPRPCGGGIGAPHAHLGLDGGPSDYYAHAATAQSAHRVPAAPVQCRHGPGWSCPDLPEPHLVGRSHAVSAAEWPIHRCEMSQLSKAIRFTVEARSLLARHRRARPQPRLKQKGPDSFACSLMSWQYMYLHAHIQHQRKREHEEPAPHRTAPRRTASECWLDVRPHIADGTGQPGPGRAQRTNRTCAPAYEVRTALDYCTEYECGRASTAEQRALPGTRDDRSTVPPLIWFRPAGYPPPTG